MFACFAYDTISEAACASQRLHTISCGHAMCHLLFPLTHRVFSPCHIFLPELCYLCCYCFCPQCKFALSLPCVLPRAFARNPNFAIEFAARAFTPATYLPLFLPPMLPLPLPLSVFSIHVALQIATAIAIAFALEVAMLVAIKFGRLIEHCS